MWLPFRTWQVNHYTSARSFRGEHKIPSFLLTVICSDLESHLDSAARPVVTIHASAETGSSTVERSGSLYSQALSVRNIAVFGKNASPISDRHTECLQDGKAA